MARAQRSRLFKVSLATNLAATAVAVSMAAGTFASRSGMLESIGRKLDRLVEYANPVDPLPELPAYTRTERIERQNAGPEDAGYKTQDTGQGTQDAGRETGNERTPYTRQTADAGRVTGPPRPVVRPHVPTAPAPGLSGSSARDTSRPRTRDVRPAAQEKIPPIDAGLTPQGKPVFVDPGKSQIGGNIGEVRTVSVNGSPVRIKVNPHFIGDGTKGRAGYFYPDNTLVDMDTDKNGVVSPEELEAGTHDECGYCVGVAKRFLRDHPAGVKALPLDEAVTTIAATRQLADADGNAIVTRRADIRRTIVTEVIASRTTENAVQFQLRAGRSYSAQLTGMITTAVNANESLIPPEIKKIKVKLTFGTNEIVSGVTVVAENGQAVDKRISDAILGEVRKIQFSEGKFELETGFDLTINLAINRRK